MVIFACGMFFVVGISTSRPLLQTESSPDSANDCSASDEEGILSGESELDHISA